MMDITFKYNNLPDVHGLSDLVEQKLQSLNKYLSGKDSVLCEAEFEKVAPQQNGQIHRFEINLTVDGELFRAEATEDSFEKAIDEVRDELSKELRRTKSKRDTLAKKAGRAIKGLMGRS